uniref:Uncharacterized protein n=1 Tax=Nelumbo nucifera TaxID=4432 RepID=A0A822ZXV1_NELNU|nr:TPA_asm: hypothetical protein HUJ06_018122 [Nelumbo nucifera]
MKETQNEKKVKAQSYHFPELSYNRGKQTGRETDLSGSYNLLKHLQIQSQVAKTIEKTSPE